MPDEAAIEIDGLRKTYGGVAAVRDLSLRVRRGEIFAFLGPNGAGKTTTVEILEGFRTVGYGVRIPTRTLPGLLVTLFLGAKAFCAMGIAYTRLISSEEAAPAMTNAVVLPLYFISGVFVPVSQLPAGLRQIADVLPVKPFVDALTAAFDPRTTGLGFNAGDLLVLAAWGVAGLLLAIRFFVWTPRHQAA